MLEGRPTLSSGALGRSALYFFSFDRSANRLDAGLIWTLEITIWVGRLLPGLRLRRRKMNLVAIMNPVDLQP
jgi:hypothetical protein